MEFFETVLKRACYRMAFKDIDVPRDVLIQVLEAGIRAPSGCNQQTTSFIVVDDYEVLKKIATILPVPTCQTAKAIIVCIVDERPVYNGISFYKEDCAAAVENMLLALTALGYSSVWLDGVLRRNNNAEKIAEILGIPPDKRVQVLLPIGIASTPVSVSLRKPLEERVSFNNWKNSFKND